MSEVVAVCFRQRGFEPIQQEQMILKYVNTYGKITRQQVAELCQLKEHQAYYLLQKLVELGRLKLIGKGRNAHYTIADKSG